MARPTNLSLVKASLERLIRLQQLYNQIIVLWQRRILEGAASECRAVDAESLSEMNRIAELIDEMSKAATVAAAADITTTPVVAPTTTKAPAGKIVGEKKVTEVSAAAAALPEETKLIQEDAAVAKKKNPVKKRKPKVAAVAAADAGVAVAATAIGQQGDGAQKSTDGPAPAGSADGGLEPAKKKPRKRLAKVAVAAAEGTTPALPEVPGAGPPPKVPKAAAKRKPKEDIPLENGQAKPAVKAKKAKSAPASVPAPGSLSPTPGLSTAVAKGPLKVLDVPKSTLPLDGVHQTPAQRAVANSFQKLLEKSNNISAPSAAGAVAASVAVAPEPPKVTKKVQVDKRKLAEGTATKKTAAVAVVEAIATAAAAASPAPKPAPKDEDETDITNLVDVSQGGVGDEDDENDEERKRQHKKDKKKKHKKDKKHKHDRHSSFS
jgi:hypothetical protein